MVAIQAMLCVSATVATTRCAGMNGVETSAPHVVLLASPSAVLVPT